MRWALLFLATALSAACGGNAMPPIERVILISIDTLRADYLSPYGAPARLTPRLAEEVEDALIFDDAITQATSTLPSHTSLLYSLHTFVHRGLHRKPAGAATDLTARDPAQAGYRTAAYVGGGQLRPQFGLGRGFDTYKVVNTRDINADTRFADRLGPLLEAARGFLTEHGSDPAFLFLHTYEPHLPYAPPQRFRDRVERLLSRGERLGQGEHLDAPLTPYAPDLGAPREAWDLERRRALYAAEVAYVDEFLGGLFDLLDELDLRDDTLIILLSDHGESLGERGVLGHNEFFTEQLRVPLIVWRPGAAPRRVSAAVELIDVMPTVFDLLGLDTPYPFMGRPLAAAVGSEPARPRTRFSENKGRQQCCATNGKSYSALTTRTTSGCTTWSKTRTRSTTFPTNEPRSQQR